MATIPRDPDVLDDLDYANGVETPADEKVKFSVDDKHYEIDLTEANAQNFRDKLAPEIEVATEVPAPKRSGGGGGTRKPSSNTSRPDRELTKRIRTWAEGQGIELNPQGRIPNDTRELYFESHPNERPERS